MIDPPVRNYTAIDPEIPEDATRMERMGAVVAALWKAFPRRTDGDRGISWVGFYLGPGEHTDDGALVRDDEMILVVREPKPACSPLGLHGACGQCWLSRRALVVTDVAHLGAGYVACDPRDRSEVVVPCLDASGRCWGVLDLDSYDAGAFTIDDALGLGELLSRAGLMSPEHGAGPPQVV